MTAAARTPPSAIGPATEALISAAFRDSCTLTAEATARLIGVDVKSLRAMTDAGVIRAVLRGVRTRAYTEGDIRAYLTESAGPCPSTAPAKAPTSSTTFKSKVVAFTARRASKRGAPPKR